MNKPQKKYLLINIGFVPEIGGSYRALYEIARRFPKGSIEVLTTTTQGDKAFDFRSPLNIFRSKLFSLEDSRLVNKTKILLPLTQLLVVLRTLHQFKKGNYDLLITGQSWTTGYAGWLMKKFVKCKHATFIYGEELSAFLKCKNFYRKALFRKSIENAEIVIANSNPTKEEGIKFGIPEEKLHVVQPGADTDFFKPDIDVSSLRERYKTNGKKVILTISRLTEQKGHDMVMKALPLLMEKLPSIVYFVVGKGPEKKRLMALSRRLGLQDEIFFVEDVRDEDLPRFYNLCDLFIMPNRVADESRSQEGFGMVFIEANACGKPVIGGNTGGAVDAIIDGETGFLVNPTDEYEIAKKMFQLLEDSKLALELGGKGCLRARQEFGWKAIAEKTMVILSAVV